MDLSVPFSILNPPPILDSSKLKEFADNNLKFDKNGRKFSKPLENTVGKGEIYLQQCFQKTCAANTKKTGLVRDRVNEKFKSDENIFRNFIECHMMTQTKPGRATAPPCIFFYNNYARSENSSLGEIVCWCFHQIILPFIDPEKKAFENMVGKDDNAGNQQFLLYPLKENGII